MPFLETIRLALDSMRGNAFRSALTMLGVIIGVAAVIAMLALGRGAKAAVDAQLATLGADVLTVTTGMRWMGGVARDQQTLTMKDADAETMLKDFLDVREAKVKVQKDYVSKFKKVLPATLVGRYYQIENKIDAIVNLEMAAGIPLVK